MRASARGGVGASGGAGLGNAFLSHIKAVDGILHVMRAFDDADVIHVEDRVDPVDDIEIITSELRIKDLEFMNNHLAKMNKDAQRAAQNPTMAKAHKAEMETINKVIAWLEEGKEVRNGMDQWTTSDVDFLNTYQLLTAKPVIYLINLTKKDFARKKNKWLPKLKVWLDENRPGEKMIPYASTRSHPIRRPVASRPPCPYPSLILPHPSPIRLILPCLHSGAQGLSLVNIEAAGLGIVNGQHGRRIRNL